MPIAAFSSAVNAPQDIPSPLDIKALPPLVWVGSSQVIPAANINEDGKHIKLVSGETLAFDITQKIPTNLSYWNDSTLKFFSQRPVRLRGELQDSKFTARTVWPLDYTILPNLPIKPLDSKETLKTLVQYENGGAKSTYESRLIWQKSPDSAQKVANKAVLGLMLNGAQGDDDEAHGGHFAIVTGRMESDGNYSRWLVNNFYNLASNSEKGIIAGVTPMDKYLMDLNNGQSFYRPSYMLIAVLKEDRIAKQYQAAINRVYNHFYRNDFVYDHSRDNCAGVSLDTLKALGWNVPTRGVENQLKAIAAYFYVSASEMSPTKGRAIYDYLNTETTRLFPAVAFDAIGEDLLSLVQHQAKSKVPSTFESSLIDSVEAIYFVRIPQIPSSRAFGLAPIYSFDQYMQQAPADRSQWKVVPTTPNPMPDSLKDGLALKLEKPSLMPWSVAAALALFIMSLVISLTWVVRNLRKK
jgi:hypothetical protein